MMGLEFQPHRIYGGPFNSLETVRDRLSGLSAAPVVPIPQE